MVSFILLKTSTGLIFKKSYLSVLTPGSINLKQLNECGVLLFVSSVHKIGLFKFFLNLNINSVKNILKLYPFLTRKLSE